MKFFCNGQDLANATNIVSKALSYKKNIPALEGIKIVAENGSVLLSAFSPELFIERKITAEVVFEGEIVVGGRLFNDYVAKLSSKDNIVVERVEEKLIVTCGDGVVEFPCFPVENYPSIEDDEEDEKEKEFLMKAKDFKELIERSIFCLSSNDNRMLLKCCNIEVKGSEIEAVCLDGYRIAISKKLIAGDYEKFKIIIVGRIISDVIKVIEDNEDIINIKKKNNNLYLDIGHTKIKINTSEGDTFNYSRYIPAAEKNVIIINKEEMLGCLERALIICRDSKFNKITINIDKDRMNIQCESEISRFNENISCKNSGDEIKMGVNCRYLQEAITRIKEDFVKIIVEVPAKPMVVKAVEDDEYKCIVLPLRLIG